MSIALVALAGCGGGAVVPARIVQPKPSAEAAIEIPKPIAPADKLKVTDRVAIETAMGTIVVALFGEDAPGTVANFLSYVDKGFYDGKIFHRVIPGFMIQGGGFDEALVRAETGEPIRLEIIPGLKHVAGTVSMARTSEPNSATAQFFICVAPAPQLNGAYSSFGVVEEGLDVANAISVVSTQAVDNERGRMDDVPVTPIPIKSVRRVVE